MTKNKTRRGNYHVESNFHYSHDVLSMILVSMCIVLLAPHSVNASSPTRVGRGWLGNILGVNGSNTSDSGNNSIRTINAAINKDDQEEGASLPPPPPPPQPESFDMHPKKPQQHQSQQQQYNNDIRPWGTSTAATNAPPPPNVSLPPPPPPQFDQPQTMPPQQNYPDDWHMRQMYAPQQQQSQHQQLETDETIQSLQSDIDSLLTHQNGLYNNIQNLTTTIQENEQTLKFQVNQIDVLLEQVADAEAYASAESNAALEYKQNCTVLSENVHSLQSQIGELEAKCLNLEKNETCQIDEIGKLKDKVKKKEKELENMACGVEMARLEQQKVKYKEQLQKKKMKKSRGLVSWLFGYIFSSSSSRNDLDNGHTADELEKLQDLARSTLLHALQSERNNVHELEASLSTTQQNNSAIAEMVSSRDSLIDELNERVAVFEEDKLVLKAALRQLQKEMKDEAPKTQKLLLDLDNTKNDIDSLEETIDKLKSNHTYEIESLEDLISEKDAMINETDSKMSMISVYVDQLEERLATFAVARRDINVREGVCIEIEEREKQMSKDFSTLEKQIKNVTKSRDELQVLVDSMTDQCAQLEKEKKTLSSGKASLLQKEKALHEELHMLQDQYQTLEERARETQLTLDKTQQEVLEREENLEISKQLNHQSDQEIERQKQLLEETSSQIVSLQEEITTLETENSRIVTLVLTLEEKIESENADAEDKFMRQVVLEAERIAEERFESFLIAERRIAEEKTLDDVLSSQDEESNNVDDQPVEDNGQDMQEIGVDESQQTSQTNIHDEIEEYESFVDSQDFMPPPPPPPPISNLSEDIASDDENEVVDENSVLYPPPFSEQDIEEVKEPMHDLSWHETTAETNVSIEDENYETDISAEFSNGDITQASDNSHANNVPDENYRDDGEDVEIQYDHKTEVTRLEEPRSHDDDFEVISDEESYYPPGYFENHFDDEEVFTSFYDDSVGPSRNESEVEMSLDTNNVGGEDDRASDSKSEVDRASESTSEDDESENQMDIETEETGESYGEVDEEASLDELEVGVVEGNTAPSKDRKVPFRNLRKKFSSLTGVHGLFTPASKRAAFVVPKPH